MFTITRTSKTPASPIRILVSERQGGDTDAGLSAGGVFHFYPADSEDGDTTYSMSEHAARVIMGDPGHAGHFTCTPDLPAQVSQGAEDVSPAAPRRARGKRRPRANADSGAGE